MKQITLLILNAFLFLNLNAQTPTVLIPNATLGTPTNFASDGSKAYYLTRSNSSPAVISLYTIVGNSTTPVFVKDILREDTASITTMSTTSNHGLQTAHEAKIDYFTVVNGKMLLTYTVKPSQFSFNITGYRLLVSDGTAAGTTLALSENLTTPTFFNGALGGLQLFKTDNVVYFTYVEADASNSLKYYGKVYKTDGTVAGTTTLFTTPTNESLLSQPYKIMAKNGWVYFSTYTLTGASLNTISDWKYYRTNGNTPELISTETASLNTNYFNVSNTHILVAFVFQASIVGLPGTTASVGLKKIALTSGFPVAATYAINPYTPNTGNGAKDGYDFPCAEFNGTFYVSGFKDYKKCMYKIESSNVISSWDFPLNAGFTFNIPQGDISFKKTDNRLYMDHFYSAHPYINTSAYTPLNARTSSLYYLTGGDPILVDSSRALQGVIDPREAATCGNTVLNNSRFLVTGSSFVYQNKLWKTDGTKTNTGYVANLYNCTPGSFSVNDINPMYLAKHNNKIYFSGSTGCGVADVNPALFTWDVCTTVPVTWVSFDGKLVNKKVQLTWKTANEVDNIGFDVERSDDGRTFTKIGFLSSTNQSNNNYSYSDDFMGKIVYYRLKQLDKNGRFEYSKVVIINSKLNTVKIYPSPATNYFSIEGFKEEIKQVKLIDAQGKIIKQWNNYQTSYSVQNVVAGVYCIVITTQNETISKTIILNK